MNVKKEFPQVGRAAWFVLVFLAAVHSGMATAADPADARVADLYKAARAEGVVSVWSHNAEEMQWIPAAFGRTFPGIKIEFVIDLNAVSKVVTEARAGRHAADVVWNSEALVRPLIERNLLVRESWEKYGVRAADVGASGHMLITNSATFAVAYRKDRVAAADVPATWNDLLHPKYRNKMAAGPILFARLCAALGVFGQESALLEYARRIRGEGQVLWTNELLQQTIESGERPYVAGITNYLAEGWKKRNPAIEVVLPEPIFVMQFGAVVTSRAPHPNAARLLALWLAGPQGRKAREEALLAVDLRPSSEHPQAVALRTSGKRLYVDSPEAVEARNKLIPEMDRIMAGL